MNMEGKLRRKWYAQAAVKEGDIVWTRAGQNWLVGYVTDIMWHNGTNGEPNRYDNIVIQPLHHMDDSSFHADREDLWIPHEKSVKDTVQDIEQLIDLALITKDKAWFKDLSDKLNTLKSAV